MKLNLKFKFNLQLNDYLIGVLTESFETCNRSTKFKLRI